MKHYTETQKLWALVHGNEPSSSIKGREFN